MNLKICKTTSKGNSLGDTMKQVLKIIEEAQEIEGVIIRKCYSDEKHLPVSSLPKCIRAHIIEEVIDCITACCTLLGNYGFDEDEIQEIAQFVIEKNRIRGV